MSKNNNLPAPMRKKRLSSTLYRYKTTCFFLPHVLSYIFTNHEVPHATPNYCRVIP